MIKFSKNFLLKEGIRLLLVLMVIFVFAPMAQSQQLEDQILRYAIKHSDIGFMYPPRVFSDQDDLITHMIFNGLLRYPPGSRSVDAMEGDLAKEVPIPEILPDGRQQWVFNLRHGILFHPYPGNPGYELTSEDVVYSLRLSADPKCSGHAGEYSGITFEAIDRYTVKVIVEKPISPLLFLPKFANQFGGLILCKKAFEEKGYEWFKVHPLGTGPFMFNMYKPREKVVLVRNEKYYRGKPRLAKVEVLFTPSLASREMALQKGEVDVTWGVRSQTWVEKMEKIPGIAVNVVRTIEPYVLHFNMSMPPMNNLKVRQAIAYALDRNQFVAFLGRKVCFPLYSAVPAGLVLGGLTKGEVVEAGADLLYEFDLSKAKKLIAEAGYPNGFKLSLHATINPAYANAWPLIESQLNKIGITIESKQCDHPTWHTMIRKNLNSLVLYDGGRPNADIFLTQWYHSDSIVVTGEKSVTNFSHIGEVDVDGDGKIDSIDDLIYAARIEVNPEKQVKLWKKAQIELLRWLVSYPLYRQSSAFATKPNFHWGHELKLIHGFPKPNEDSRILPY